MDWKKKLSKNFSSKANRPSFVKDKLAETTQLTSNYSLHHEEMMSLPSIDGSNGNQNLLRQSPWSQLEDGDNPVEETELVKATTFSLVPYGNCGSMNGQPSIEFGNYVPAQPVIDQIWRGFFNILGKENERLELVAHLSNKACSKVFDAATLLPPELDVHILPKCEVWPKSFKRSPPTDDRIALYFFPMYERDEKVFDTLLDEINEYGLSLKALINNVELLVFSSLELPQRHWRFCRKYYMWGVFRQKQHSLALEQTSSHLVVQSGSSQSGTPSEALLKQ